MKTGASFHMEVGRLVCAPVRDYLNARIALGDDIKFHEGRGWIGRVFYVSGDVDTVIRIYRDMIARFPPNDKMD